MYLCILAMAVAVSAFFGMKLRTRDWEEDDAHFVERQKSERQNSLKEWVDSIDCLKMQSKFDEN